MTCYFSQSLLKPNETYKGVQAGIADIACYNIGINPGAHDINRVINLPFMGFNMEDGTEIFSIPIIESCTSLSP